MSVGAGIFRLAGLTLLVVVLTAARCSQSSQVQVTSVTAVIPDSAEQVIMGGRVVMTDRGIMKGVLLADTVIAYENGTRLELRQVNVTFYTAHGSEDGVLTARQGTYNSRLSRLEARGSVIVVAEDGRRLDTEQLVYDQLRNQIFSDSAFVLNRPPQQIMGIGFESDPQLQVFKVLRGFKGVAPVKLPPDA